jgi:putative Ca2+/H+ antiporter (TMEM165/GDT1 family)
MARGDGKNTFMDWKLALTTFGAVFLAELGDKTQLATLAFATTGRSRWAVFIGAASALVATSAIAVLAGDAVTRAVPPTFLKRAAGAAFVAIGLWVLWSSRPGG